MSDRLRSLTCAHWLRLPLLALFIAGLATQDRALHAQTAPSHTLYCAEGATEFFTTSIDLVNPSAADTASATVTFVGDSGPLSTKTITIAPGASQSTSLNSEVGVVAPPGRHCGHGWNGRQQHTRRPRRRWWRRRLPRWRRRLRWHAWHWGRRRWVVVHGARRDQCHS